MIKAVYIEDRFTESNPLREFVIMFYTKKNGQKGINKLIQYT